MFSFNVLPDWSSACFKEQRTYQPSAEFSFLCSPKQNKLVHSVRPSFAYAAFWPWARICVSLMPPHSKPNTPCEEQLPSSPMPKLRGASVPSVLPSAHRGFPEPQGSVTMSHTALSILPHEQRAPAFSPTAGDTAGALLPSYANPK